MGAGKHRLEKANTVLRGCIDRNSHDVDERAAGRYIEVVMGSI